MNSCTNSILLLRMDLHYCIFRCLYFLFLCYKNIESTTAQTTLNELQALVHHDQGLYVCDRYRDISWQILGRCHQIIGNFSDAHYSYQQSLAQYPFNGIQVATLMKIQEISQTKITLVQTLTTNSILVYVTEMLPCIMSSVSCLKKSKTLLSIPWG